VVPPELFGGRQRPDLAESGQQGRAPHHGWLRRVAGEASVCGLPHRPTVGCRTLVGPDARGRERRGPSKAPLNSPKTRQKLGQNRSRASEPRTPVLSTGSEVPGNAHHLPSRVARPRGFEPLTFGSVDRGSEAYIWRYRAKFFRTSRPKVAKSRLRGIFGRGDLMPPRSLATRERARARQADRRPRLVRCDHLVAVDGRACICGGSRGLAPSVRATAAAASASVLAPNRVASSRSAVPSSWRRACAANRVLEFRPFGCRLNRGRDTPPGLRSPPYRRRPRPRYRPVCDSRAHRNNGARGGAEGQVHADLPGRCGVAG
jgi:hypothetical protein